MSKKLAMWESKRRGMNITKLMARDGMYCKLCGQPLDRHIKDDRSPDYVTFDHIVPSSAGGLDDLSNLQLAHQSCNQARGNMSIEEYLERWPSGKASGLNPEAVAL